MSTTTARLDPVRTPHPAARWPIGAAMMAFPGTTPDGRPTTDAPPAVWAAALQEVALAGFDHIDLTDTWVRVPDLDGDRLGTLAELVSEHHLAVSAVSLTRHSVIAPDAEEARANLEYTLRGIPATARLGASVLSLGLHQPMTPEQQRAQWFWHVTGHRDPDDPAVFAAAVEAFRLVGQRAADHGLAVSLEMYEDTLLGTSEGAVALIEAIDLPNVGLNPDIGNIVRLHRPVEDWRDMLRRMLPHTNYWHVKNYLRDHDPATGAYFSAPAPMESGYIDYRAAIGLALEHGFSGPFCTEHYGGDGLSVSATNRDYIRRILAAKAGE